MKKDPFYRGVINPAAKKCCGLGKLPICQIQHFRKYILNIHCGNRIPTTEFRNWWFSIHMHCSSHATAWEWNSNVIVSEFHSHIIMWEWNSHKMAWEFNFHKPSAGIVYYLWSCGLHPLPSSGDYVICVRSPMWLTLPILEMLRHLKAEISF